MREFVSILLICSATMSVLGLIYAALTPLLSRRYSAKGRYYGWLVIVIGLIIPFRPRFGGAMVPYDFPSPAIPSVGVQSYGFAMAAPPEMTLLPPTMPSVSLWQIVAAVWFVGMIAFVAYHAVKHFRFTKMATRWSENVALEQALPVLEGIKAEMGITRDIGLYQCPTIGSPLLMGFIHPRILLPQASIPIDELAFILRHELIHYQRRDLWYKCAVLLAAAIHWFNPILYLLVKAIDTACELSCDAATVRNADPDARQRYSETIIGVVRYQSKRKTALSTNFYGGKRGMKKRIDSIMDSGRKKAGITLLCGMLILTLATGMAFAASTTESKAPSLEQYDPIPDISAVSQADQAMMTRFDPETGKTFYSWDLGKTWMHLTDEEYDRMFSQPAAQWWTYEEYKAWMDEQIKGLQALVDDGGSGYYDKDGVLHNFIQADVDEAAALYQATLENIQSGYRVSKPVDGSALSQDILPGAGETYAIASDNGNMGTDQNYSEYAQYGLAYDATTHQLYYHGELVRRFYDERTSSVVTRTFNPSGVVDITARRNENHVLMGLYKHSQQEFEDRTEAMGADASLSVAQQQAVATAVAVETPTRNYRQYADHGLAFDTATGKLYYQGERVRYFEDSYPLGENMAAYIDYFDQEGTIDVHAIRDLSRLVYSPDGSYDPSGILVGVEPYSQSEFNARDIARHTDDNPTTQVANATAVNQSAIASYQNPITSESSASVSADVSGPSSNDTSYSPPTTAVNASAVGSSETGGQTFQQIFEEYRAYGITYDPSSAMGGLGNIYYHGKLVKTFVDISPSGGVISFSSSDGGEIIVRTIYGQAGQLTGLEAAEE